MYLEEINRFPLLTREEEVELAQRYVETGDLEAAQRLVTANLRFVVKVAYEYRKYDINLGDLIQEGNIGLMKAISKFNPDRGYRLISYAVWWIRAYMQNYIVKNWSVVKMRSGGRHRSLFFRTPTDDDQKDESKLLPEESSKTREAKASKRETRLAMRDFSLDAVMDGEGTRSYIDLLASPDAPVDDELARSEEHDIVTAEIAELSEFLNEKERFILTNRVLTDEPQTLQEIGERFGISRERVRQIEVALKKKIEKNLRQHEAFANR